MESNKTNGQDVEKFRQPENDEKPFPFHEYSAHELIKELDEFDIKGDEYSALDLLYDQMQLHKQKEILVTPDKKIIKGLRTFRILNYHQIPPILSEFNGNSQEIYEIVWNHYFNTLDINKFRRACFGIKHWPQIAEENKAMKAIKNRKFKLGIEYSDAEKNNEKTDIYIARKYNTNSRYVRIAKLLKQYCPEKFEQFLRGKLTDEGDNDNKTKNNNKTGFSIAVILLENNLSYLFRHDNKFHEAYIDFEEKEGDIDSSETCKVIEKAVKENKLKDKLIKYFQSYKKVENATEDTINIDSPDNKDNHEDENEPGYEQRNIPANNTGQTHYTTTSENESNNETEETNGNMEADIPDAIKAFSNISKHTKKRFILEYNRYMNFDEGYEKKDNAESFFNKLIDSFKQNYYSNK